MPSSSAANRNEPRRAAASKAVRARKGGKPRRVNRVHLKGQTLYVQAHVFTSVTHNSTDVMRFSGEFSSPVHENYRLSGSTRPEHGMWMKCTENSDERG